MENSLNCNNQFCVVSSPVSEKNAGEQVQHYADFFRKVRNELYYKNENGAYKPKCFQGIVYKNPEQELRHALSNPTDCTNWDDDDRTFIPDILAVFKDNYDLSGISLVAQGYTGWKGAVFLAQHNDGLEPYTIRIGVEESFHHFSMPYTPLNQQVYSQTIFSKKGAQGLDEMIIERGPAPSMVDFVWDRESPYPPHGFGKFINDHILKDTPYEVKMHRDLSIFCDGTPLYADPDSIGFKDPEMGKREITLEEHQKIMATIYANCRAIGWPEDLSWVVKNSSGEYMFKQDVLYPDPLELPKEERLHYVGYRQYPGWKDVYPQLVQEW